MLEKIKKRINGPIVQHKRPEGVEAYWCLPTMAMEPERAPRENRALMEMGLAASREAQEVDFADLAGRPNCKRWLTVWPGEHYKLLAGLVKVLRPGVVIEVGTAEGLSALAMKKYMPKEGKVITFDIVPWEQITDTLLAPEDFADGRLEQRLGDLADERTFEANRELMERAEFLFIDGPKDNEFEWRLLERLKTVRFRRPPILMFDDTKLWSMLKFWRELPYPKLDLTSFGHSSGTGLVQWEQG
ncbi:MAG TPA: class I SAM-dependent methyltransferase [Tepidisphaeraceae bacterium]|jgi:predicted O-methyltransferase YrrM|nr:class I SAM-dependent methyltransferase [Tepidisphaeraceae bacterium]